MPWKDADLEVILNIGCDVEIGCVGELVSQHFANPHVIHCCALDFVSMFFFPTCLKSAFQIYDIFLSFLRSWRRQYFSNISALNRLHILEFVKITICYLVPQIRPPLWSSGHSFWLQIQRSWVRFLALPDFLRSSESGTGSTQPREDNWGATWKKNVAAPVKKTEINDRGNPLRLSRSTLYPQNLALLRQQAAVARSV
jgi:hypothetical protein